MHTAILLSLATLQPVPDSWLDSIEKIESGGHAIYGDYGKAKGIFQFHREAWNDCSAMRFKAGLPVYNYSEAMDDDKSRAYAQSWLTYLRGYLSEKYGRPAHLGEVWLAFNLGLNGFSRYNYNWMSVEGFKYRKAVEVMMIPVKLKSL